ncbi:MAG: leucine--tRNA ligase [Elusimicrobiota bacterium]|nr:leucine--tRNA ligase [Elusimicrobiota bacterium]
MNYDFKSIEAKWQKFWQENFQPTDLTDNTKPKFYCLVMFPYPSGHIHMGHVRNYIIGDVIAQYKRMRGYNVFHPIGWDAFGLPAENAAIQHNIAPQEWTKHNIDYMRRQLKQLGILYDWSREISTCDPSYYRWNQWFFTKMFEQGLAYRKKAPVNWCPSCKTVLANEQVEAGDGWGRGSCWRCSSLVEEKELEQWFLKITHYAEELLEGHKLIENGWPEEVISMQKNWIGRSEGCEVEFLLTTPISLRSNLTSLTIFTTRPDTLFGATFIALSPEHPLSKAVRSKQLEVRRYIEKVKNKNKTTLYEKTGIFTGLYAINPVNNEKIPVWIADYVTPEYGTGAIMCVPAHDSRDFEFAKKYNLPIREVIQPPSTVSYQPSTNEAYEGEGKMINSGEFTGLASELGRERIIKFLEEKGVGKKKVNYRLKDWLISRQRYWGTPIPIVYCNHCGIVPVPENMLPVLLPENVTITGTGESPLKYIPEFYNTNCPKCNSQAVRETDTMDTFVDSSWYYARYCDPQNIRVPFDSKIVNLLLPVDQYIGGIEHACMHLIYARFFHKVMRDLGLVNSDEPFLRLLTQGMVTLGGVAMSKSRGNIVEPQEVIEKFGVDALRMFILFAAPPEKQLEWKDRGIEGCVRFLNRLWRITFFLAGKKKVTKEKPIQQRKSHNIEAESSHLLRKLHQTIKKVTDDIEKNYQFNTAIAHLMELTNELYQYSQLGDDISKEVFKNIVVLLSPFAPHIAEELASELGISSLHSIREYKWIEYNPELIEEPTIEIAIQINGRLRGTVTVKSGISEDELKNTVINDEKIKKHINGREIKKQIYVPNKLMNIVTTEKFKGEEKQC